MLSTYLTVRIIAAIVFAVILLIFLVKRKKGKKISILNLIVIVAVFFAVTAFIPAENLFLKFDSPQEAFAYVSNDIVTDEIETEDFTALIYKKSVNAFDAYVVQNVSGGYKLPFIFSNTVKSVELPYEFPSLSVKVCKLGSGEKSLLIIFEYNALPEEEMYIFSDTQGNEFLQLEKRTVGEENETVVAIHYAKIDSTDGDYELIIKRDNVTTNIEID